MSQNVYYYSLKTENLYRAGTIIGFSCKDAKKSLKKLYRYPYNIELEIMEDFRPRYRKSKIVGICKVTG